MKRPHFTSVGTWFCYKFSTFKTSPAVGDNLIGRHQWGCKLEWVRLRNVPQPIRRLNLRLTANQVMVRLVPERPLTLTQWTFLNFSLQEISASFPPSINCLFPPSLCVPQKYVDVREARLSGNCILLHAKEMFPLSLPLISLAFILSRCLSPLCLPPMMGKEPKSEFLCLRVLFG